MSEHAPKPRLSALERARADLAAGRPDRARDRVTGYLYTLHRRGEYKQDAYLLLGEIYYAMRDFPRAAAAWLLTEKQDAEMETALQAFTVRYGQDAVNVLRQVKPHAPSEDYPPLVQARLKSWDYRYRTYRPRSNPHTLGDAPPEAQRGLRPVEIGCGLFLLAIIVAVALWLFRPLLGR